MRGYANGAQLHFASLVFHFFSPFARFVCISARSGSPRLGVARAPTVSLSLSPSLFISLPPVSPLLRPSSVLASREPRPSSSVPLARVLPPLHPLAGPRGYQPLVFTSGQLGGDFDKTTSKLNPPARLFPPQIPLEPARALTLATATSAPAPCVGRGRSEGRGGECGGSRDLHSISSRAHREGGSQKRRSIDESTHTYRRICQNKSPVFRRVTF